jgi:hypothetical protein
MAERMKCYVYVYINDTFNKIDCGGFTYLYCGIKIYYSCERKVIGRKHVVVDVDTLSLIKNMLKRLGMELTAPHHRQLVCYKWYVGARA